MTGHGEESSLEQYQMMRASELYPKKQIQTDDTGLQVPFPVLSGESVEFLGRTTDGVIALSNFRLFVRFKDSFVNVPLGLIESVEYRDIFFIYVCCKDAHSFRCTFSTNEFCLEWYKRLCTAVNPPQKLMDVFSFAFYAHCKDSIVEGNGSHPLCRLVTDPQTGIGYSFDREVERMGLINKQNDAWRITHINEDFKTCGSYPRLHIVPKLVEDTDIESAAGFRGSKRFPSVVWRDRKSGAVICRSSQPEVGWLGWRNPQDENLIVAIAAACTANTNVEEVHTNSSKRKATDPRKMLILDARSYPAAVANRAKGGGCECIEYYPNCEIQFMSLANIHTIRKSFHAIRALCSAAGDQPGWLQGIETTKWLHHISGMLKAALTVVTAIDKEYRPVLVHCSDGWDRTPQIVALAEIMLDSHYRTIEGFRVLVEREWLEFGHKFADRCGIGKCSEDTNERCPVFLQFLDCVHQLLVQEPCAFQFNQAYLVKLAQHTYSNLFGTFLCNNTRDRENNKVPEQTSSVWSLLSRNRQFVNPLYIPQHGQIIEPSWYLKDMNLWRSVYMSKIAPSAALEEPEDVNQMSDEGNTLPPCDDIEKQMLPKTRSCENLLTMSGEYSSMTSNGNRRLSDPNIKADPNLLVNGTNGHTANANSDAYEESERNDGHISEIRNTKNIVINEDDSVRFSNMVCGTGSSDTLVPESSPPKRIDDSSQTDEITTSSISNGQCKDDIVGDIEDGENCDKTPQCSMLMENSITPDKQHLNLESKDVVTSFPEVHQHLSKSTQEQLGDADNIDGNINDCQTDVFKVENVGNKSCSVDGEPVIASQPTATDNCVDGNIVITRNGGDNVILTPTENIDSSDRTDMSLSTSQEEVPCQIVDDKVVNQTSHKNSFSTTAEVTNESKALPSTQVDNTVIVQLKHNNILACRAADISTSTSDISDSHVDIDFKSRLANMKSKRPCAQKIDETLLGLDMGTITLDKRPKRHLQNDIGLGSSIAGSRESSHSSMPSEGGSLHASGGNSSTAESPSPSSDKMSWLSRQVQGVTRYLDVDGLQTYDDPAHKRTLQIMAMYKEHIRHMEEKLHTAKSLLYHYTSGRNGNGSKPNFFDSDTPSESEGEEHTSLGGRSGASDVSYEMIGDDDSLMTLWVPDHAVTHCTGCDREFWIVRRRHHCRNCGKVYCGTCAPHYVPVPQQHLPNPVRVCRTCYLDIDFDPVEENQSQNTEAEIEGAMREIVLD